MLLHSESFAELEQGTNEGTTKLSCLEDLTLPADVLSHLVSKFQDIEDVTGKLEEMGGIQGLADKLYTNTKTGLITDKKSSSEELIVFPIRVEKYGRNIISQLPPTHFMRLILAALNDRMLIVLIVAGVANLVLGVIDNYRHEWEETTGWIDGFAVLLAVVIVVLVTACNDRSKEKKFRQLDKQNQERECFVLRNGEPEQCKNTDIVVGDCVLLKTGNEIPCDGVFISGTDDLKVDESLLTGETLEIPKDTEHPLLLGGTQLASGEGLMLAICVGDNSYQGETLKELQQECEDTPLQIRLTKLADKVGLVGTIAAVALFIILIVKWVVRESKNDGDFEDWDKNVLDAFTLAVSIVVMSVPEGLPLAVTISMAYSMRKMMDDQNFVRVLAACETMGNVTTICSDKTGTLTQNVMTVVTIWFDGKAWTKAPEEGDLIPESNDIIQSALIVSSGAVEQLDDRTGQMKLVGANQTDCALVRWAMSLRKVNLSEIRERPEHQIKKHYPFHSALKRSGVLLNFSEDSYRLIMKGAAEIVLTLCSKVYSSEGSKGVDLCDEIRNDITKDMMKMTKYGLRCMGVCYKDIKKDTVKLDESGKIDDDVESNPAYWQDFTWVTLTGIKDPVRPEVPDAVEAVHEAGIVVRMVTGDHIETAKYIARECGILTAKHHEVMLGSEFRALSDEEKHQRLPNLRVLARSNPKDKQELVRWYKEAHPYAEHSKSGKRDSSCASDEEAKNLTVHRTVDVVAVTGDGANDALALKVANVGLAMGISGTDVAKRACDIVIMDDNFASIVKTVMWGRSVYDNIRKFVQFQLTVNVVAVTLTLCAAFMDNSIATPLTPVQLLWVNLIMDTMAALALATEKPTMDLLKRYPYHPNSTLISKRMWRFILGHSVWQIILLLILLVLGKPWFDNEDTVENMDKAGRNEKHLCFIFNVFVWFQIWNEINARKVNGEWKVLERFFENPYFSGILLLTVILQVFIVEVGGILVHTTHLDWYEWLFAIAMGSTTLLVNQVVRLIPVVDNEGVRLDGDEFMQEEEFSMMWEFDEVLDKSIMGGDERF